MKKYLSVLFVAVFGLILTGCGKSDTLKCTIEEEYKSEVEVSFKDDKASKVVSKTELEDEKTAKSYARLISAYATDGIKVSTEGKKVVMTYSGKGLEASEGDSGLSFEGTKDEIKKAAEKDGWKCN